MMWEKAELLTKVLKNEVESGNNATNGDSSVVELSSWASKVTLDIIGVAGLGRNINSVEKSSDPLQETYEELLEPSREKLLFSMMSLAFGFSYVRFIPWKMNNLFNHLVASLNSICGPMIREKREAILKKGDDHFDILSLLIKSNNFSDVVLKDQLLTFLAAGSVIVNQSSFSISNTPLGMKLQHLP